MKFVCLADPDADARKLVEPLSTCAPTPFISKEDFRCPHCIRISAD